MEDEEPDPLSDEMLDLDVLKTPPVIDQVRRQIRAESEFQASVMSAKSKDKTVQGDTVSGINVDAFQNRLREVMQQSPEVSAVDAAKAGIRGQNLQPPSTLKLENLDLDTDDAEYDEGGLFDHEHETSSESTEKRGWARSHGLPSSRSSSGTSGSIRSSSSGSSSKDKKKSIAFGLDGTSKSWRPHSSRSSASVGLDSDRAFNKGGSFQQLKDSLKMTPIAKQGESVDQAIERVSKLPVPPRPKPEVRSM